MPIVSHPKEGSPLKQGDILRNVPFPVTNAAGKTASDADVAFVLVISRPCKALRDDLVVVAPIIPYPVDLTDTVNKDKDASPVGSLDRARRYLAAVRDGIKGGDFSDSLYLGPLEDGTPRRFAAQLSTLGTVMVPKRHEERERWVQERRVWTLEEQFLRDLHTRLVLTYTRLGFDDHDWYSTEDLEMLITFGQRELAHCKGEFASADQEVRLIEAQNKQVPQDKQKLVESRRKKVAEAEERLKPYLEEQERRRAQSKQ